MIFTLIIFAVLAVVVLRRPYLGIVITLSSLPLIDILPSIPGVSSAISLMGGVTLLGFLITGMKKKSEQGSWMQIPPALISGLLFLLWLLSNFSAAIMPASDGRVWIFTYIQLWLLAWLASLLLENPQQIRVLMWGFFLAGLVSAIYAGAQGVIGLTIKTSIRAEGLAGGANAAARYFLIALMFAYFLLTQESRRRVRLFLLGGMVVLLYGVFVTVSRTGLLLLTTGIALLTLQSIGSKQKGPIVILALAVIATVWVLADNITAIFQGISGSILSGTDTVGIRYGLWQAGLRMWVDYPLAGVGVGQFSNNLPFYGWDLLQPRYLGLGPHNLYIGVLSETGLFGIFFFLTMFFVSIRSLLSATSTSDSRVKQLALAWLVVIVLILMAGITKQDQYDKLTWLVVGVSAAIDRMSRHESTD